MVQEIIDVELEGRVAVEDLSVVTEECVVERVGGRVEIGRDRAGCTGEIDGAAVGAQAPVGTAANREALQRALGEGVATHEVAAGLGEAAVGHAFGDGRDEIVEEGRRLVEGFAFGLKLFEDRHAVDVGDVVVRIRSA